MDDIGLALIYHLTECGILTAENIDKIAARLSDDSAHKVRMAAIEASLVADARQYPNLPSYISLVADGGNDAA